MHLYQGTTRQFIGDATQARLANILAEWFEEMRYRPSPSEVRSWQHSPGPIYPSRQVAQYQRYLQNTHPAVADRAIALDVCAYLLYAQHDPASPIYHADCTDLLATNPAFAGDPFDANASRTPREASIRTRPWNTSTERAWVGSDRSAKSHSPGVDNLYRVRA